MENGEEPREERQKDASLVDDLRYKTKKANKSNFKMKLKKALAIIKAILISLKILWPAIIIFVIIAAVSHMLDFTGSSRISDVASKDTIKEEVSIANAGGDNYYLKINYSFVEKYKEKLEKAYYDGYFTKSEPSQDTGKKPFKYDPDEPQKVETAIARWFKTEKYRPYLIKMIRAQLSCMYPRLSDYRGVSKDEIENPLDGEGDYAEQGTVDIKRVLIDEETGEEEEIFLDYLPLEEFRALISAANGGDEGALQAALRHFSFVVGSDDPEDYGKMYYATYTKTITEILETGEKKVEITCQENEVDCTALSLTNMPFNFLQVLLEKTRNTEWVMKVIDLLLEDSEIIWMIQDQLDIKTTTTVHRQVERETTITYKAVEVSSSDDEEESEPEFEWKEDSSSTEYHFPAGGKLTKRVRVIEDVPILYVKKARTWCLDFEQEAIRSELHAVGEPILVEHSESEFASLTYGESTTTSSGPDWDHPAGVLVGDTWEEVLVALSNEMLPYTIKKDRDAYLYAISCLQDKTINTDRFLGLWKNDKGEYYQGCLFDPDGKVVWYEPPLDKNNKRDKKNINYPAKQIPESNGQNIHGTIELLTLHEDTEMHEELMKLYWNTYMEDTVYNNVDVEEILDFFIIGQLVNFGEGVSGSTTGVIGSTVGAGGIPINDTSISKGDFINAVTEMSKKNGWYESLGQYAEQIYDICQRNGINPMLCITIAGVETTFGESNHPQFNFWGLGPGASFNSLEEAVQQWCNLIIQYQTEDTWYNNEIKKRSEEFSQYSDMFTGGANTLADLWTIYLGTSGTPEQRIAEIEKYVKLATQIGKEVFGTKIGISEASGVADIASQFVRRRAQKVYR